MTLTIKTTKRLNNGTTVPLLGLGTWQIADGRQTQEAVSFALGFGYLHFDTAMIYGNERSVGKTVNAGPVPRDELFITTKVWNSDHGFDQTLRAFDESLNQLGLDYVDLYLIHWPVENRRSDTWRALEALMKDGRVKAIGVSNYMVRHLEELLSFSQVTPVVNQIELHPYNFGLRRDVIEFCRARDIQIVAYTPLTRGQRFDDPKLQKMARKYSKTPAQILIRWTLQHDIVVIPKSAQPERIRENAEVFDFSIQAQDMDLIDSFNEDLVICWDPADVP